MNRPSQSTLLGYLLGALDTNEQRAVEESIERDPELKQELDYLESLLARIAPIETDERPPINLARKTCDMIAAITNEPSTSQSRASSSSGSSSDFRLRQNVGWSALDMLFASAACLLISLIFVPALANSRFQSSVNTCQNNLREIGVGLVSYGDLNDGKLIGIPRSPETGFAGIYAPILKDMELVDGHNRFFCPSAREKKNMLIIPSTEALGIATGKQLRDLQRRMGGDYAYTLGYIENDRYCVPAIDEASYKVILADSPDLLLSNNQSSNHGGRGQNAMFGDFSTRFLVSCSVNSFDHIYRNDQGYVGPGTSIADSVVGASATSPFASIGF